MKVKSFSFAIFFIIILAAISSNAVLIENTNSTNNKQLQYIPGTILVGVKEEINIDELNVGDKDPIFNNLILRCIPAINLLELKVEEGKEDYYCEKYAGSSLVKYAEKNYLMYAEDTVPDDPLWDKQWGPKNIKCPQAWDYGTGSSSVTVAVIDGGADYNHPDLAPNMWTDSNGKHGYDFVNNDDDPMDKDGHGTHCAGIVAAKMDDYGIVGVAQVRIMAVKVLEDGGAAGGVAAIADGITYAADNGADVISMSFGRYFVSTKSIENACNYSWNKGSILVASAGNDNSNWAHYPSDYESVISVAATDEKNEKASFSNWGEYVDVAAPGVGIISTYLNDDYEYLSGTSMACPHVAGVVALVKSQHPSWSNEKIRQKIFDTADPLGYEGSLWEYGKVDATLDNENNPVLPDVKVTIHKITNHGDGLDKIDVDGNPEWLYEVTIDDGIKEAVANFDFTTPTKVSGEYTTYYVENFYPDGTETNTWNINKEHIFSSSSSTVIINIKVMEDDFIFDWFSDIADISNRPNPGGDYEIGYDERGRVFTAKYDMVLDKIIDEQSDRYEEDEEWFYTRGDWDGSTGPEFLDWKQDDAQLWFDITDDYTPPIADAGGPYYGIEGRELVLEGSAENGISPYIYSWDIDNDLEYELEGETIEYTWHESDTYTINLLVTDSFGQKSTDTTTVMISNNHAPNKPVISGPTEGKIGESYSYSVYSNDPDGDNVQFYFEWGDGTNTGWTEVVSSGESLTKAHSWDSKRSYTIRVKSKDTDGAESDWATLKVSMPKEKTFSRQNTLFERIQIIFYKILSYFVNNYEFRID
jgi:subtilisin family serine protease